LDYFEENNDSRWFPCTTVMNIRETPYVENGKTIKQSVYIENMKVCLIKPKIKKENIKTKYQLQIRQVTYYSLRPLVSVVMAHVLCNKSL